MCSLPKVLDISVIICTYNRSSSLQKTLDCLSRNDRTGLQVEIIVVDNNSKDDTKSVAETFAARLPLRYLVEARQGKSHALNCALNEGGLGRIIAVLDDDMSPHADWLKGVWAICERWPDRDIFSGRTYIIWPSEEVPGWAGKASIRSWIFSAVDDGHEDEALPDGRWPLGGHFWFRAKVLVNGQRFEDLWLTEPKFVLQLAERGHTGVIGPDAVAGHRVQPRLLDKAVALELAVKVGRSYAELRLKPYRRKVKQAFLFNKYPVWSRLFCVASVFRWCCLYCLAKLYWSSDERFVRTLCAVERITYYRELLRVAAGAEEYGMVFWRHGLL